MFPLPIPESKRDREVSIEPSSSVLSVDAPCLLGRAPESNLPPSWMQRAMREMRIASSFVCLCRGRDPPGSLLVQLVAPRGLARLI
jgi:hypothetical protein